MTGNDLLRRLRYALNLSTEGITEIFRLVQVDIPPVDVLKLLKKEEEPGFVSCDDSRLNRFLDGLIISRRGAVEGKAPRDSQEGVVLTNNLILRKLRIALQLQDEAMLAIFRAAGIGISKPELSALFRASDHRNYKECGDQLLRNFVKGLTLHYQPKNAVKQQELP